MAQPSEKQLAYAQSIAKRHGILLPEVCLKSAKECAHWIDEHLEHKPPTAELIKSAQDLAKSKGIQLGSDTLSSTIRINSWLKQNGGTPTAPVFGRDNLKPLSEKQMALIVRNAPVEVKTAVNEGNYKAGYQWIDVYFQGLKSKMDDIINKPKTPVIKPIDMLEMPRYVPDFAGDDIPW